MWTRKISCTLLPQSICSFRVSGQNDLDKVIELQNRERTGVPGPASARVLRPLGGQGSGGSALSTDFYLL